jgi:hypothetical protein
MTEWLLGLSAAVGRQLIMLPLPHLKGTGVVWLVRLDKLGGGGFVNYPFFLNCPFNGDHFRTRDTTLEMAKSNMVS